VKAAQGDLLHSRWRQRLRRVERELRLDDDWDPAGVPRIAPYVPEPPAPRSRSRGVDGWWTEPKRPPRPPAPPRQPAWTSQARDPFDGYFLQDDD